MESATERGKGLASWRTRDMVVAAAIAVVLGLIYQGWNQVWALLSPAMEPVLVQLLDGPYYLAALLVPYIIRKPGAALVGELIAAFVEMAAGGLWGVQIMFSGLAIGLGAEAVFFLTGYRSYKLPTLMAAALGASIPEFLLISTVFGFWALGLAVVAGKYVCLVISVLAAAVVAKLIGDALAATGVLSGFEIGRQQQEDV